MDQGGKSDLFDGVKVSLNQGHNISRFQWFEVVKREVLNRVKVSLNQGLNLNIL